MMIIFFAVKSMSLAVFKDSVSLIDVNELYDLNACLLPPSVVFVEKNIQMTLK